MTPEDRFEQIAKIAAHDYAYQKMRSHCIGLELDASRIINKLPIKSQDILWAYITHCEEMSRYVLMLACEKMNFQDEQA